METNREEERLFRIALKPLQILDGFQGILAVTVIAVWSVGRLIGGASVTPFPRVNSPVLGDRLSRGLSVLIVTAACTPGRFGPTLRAVRRMMKHLAKTNGVLAFIC